MGKRILFFSALLILLQGLTTSAQTGLYAVQSVEEEADILHNTPETSLADTSIFYSITKYYDSEIKSIQTAIRKNKRLNGAEKDKAMRSLIYFMNEVNNRIALNKLEKYDIPDALRAYRSILMALINHKPLAPLLTGLESGEISLMAAAFTQYKEYSILDDIAVYKRVASSPEFILQFLENKPGFRYADSLLVDAANYDPMKLVFYLQKETPGVQKHIHNSNNVYIRQIVSLSRDKNASELLPFLSEIASKKVTRDEILDSRTDVTRYFQLLVNTIINSGSSNGPSGVYLKPLRNGIRQKSFTFYTSQINELHDAPDAKRFVSVKPLRAEDIYYIITSSGEDLYTSSYLGLYKRLVERLNGSSSDSIFKIVRYDNFRSFIRLAANYNVLADFFGRMPGENANALLKQFISGIENDNNTALERAMDIADCFTTIVSAPEIVGVVETELQSNLRRCKRDQQYRGIRLYTILLQVLELVKQDGKLDAVSATLGNYNLLERSKLKNASNEIVEVVLFYGDEDGVSSYGNFMKHYNDRKRWEISQTENWVRIRSKSEQPVIIYANKPLDIKQEMDVKAQDNLFDYLKQQSSEPGIIVHRGHSYHLDKTLRRLQPSVKLAILGSCGGYNKAISIASINPDVQVIGSKKTGAQSINDPIIDMINETLLDNKDLHWPDIWNKLSGRFRSNSASLALFNEYFPPSKNLSLFVLKLFKNSRS